MKLSIVGISPNIFHALRRFLEANKLQDSRHDFPKATSSSIALSGVTEERLDIYKRIAAIAFDFERAYGPNSTVKVSLYRSGIRNLVGKLTGNRRLETENPEFCVSGVKVFKGVPRSFSELDEAIDKTFGKRRETQ